MKNFLEKNISICVGRQGSVTGSNIYDIVYISENILDYNLFRRGGNRIFLLYTFEKFEKDSLFNETDSLKWKSNIKKGLIEELQIRYKKAIKPEEIFFYIYSILYSNIYKRKYAEFLKIDFPRIPFTDRYGLFIQLGNLGKQLADLHLLKSDELSKPISKYSGEGNNKVTQRPKYQDERVYINSTQNFSCVSEDVWNYQIGGYQICEKWLKGQKEPGTLP